MNRIILFLLFFNVSAYAQQSKETTAMYNFIKNKQAEFPLPEDTDTVLVCYYDAVSKKFLGPGLPNNMVNNPPPPGNPLANVVSLLSEGNKTVVKFSVLNDYEPFFVTMDGKEYRSDPDIPTDNSVYIPITKNPGQSRAWKMRFLNKTQQGKFYLRSLFVAAGVFTIPYLPITIVYEPYQNAQKTNKATYVKSSMLSVSTSMTLTSETTTTKATTPSEFSGLKNFQNKAKLLSGTLMNFGPKGQTAAKALNAISDALGSVEQTTSFGAFAENNSSFVLTDLIKNTITTKENDGGPGIGDVFVYLKNARFAYLIENYKVTILPLDYKGMNQSTAAGFLIGDVDPAVGYMLELDPFFNPWGDRRIVLDKKRFEKIEEFDINGSSKEFEYSHQVTNQDRNAFTTFKSELTDMRKGTLSFLGFGPQESKTTTMVVKNSIAKEVKSQTTISASFFLEEPITNIESVEVYYDRVFGTFVVRKMPK